MVKYIWTRAKAETTRWEITPLFIEKLEEAKKWPYNMLEKVIRHVLSFFSFLPS
jgi:hypothetical protein